MTGLHQRVVSRAYAASVATAVPSSSVMTRGVSLPSSPVLPTERIALADPKLQARLADVQAWAKTEGLAPSICSLNRMPVSLGQG